MNTIVILTAKYLYVLVVLIASMALYLLPKEPRAQAIRTVLVAVPLAGLLVLFAGRFVSDPRPFVVQNVKPLFPHPADNGFPSDHTLVAALAASVVFVYRGRLGVLLAVLAILVGVSRVLANIHHPLDIAGSLAIASVSVVLARFLLHKLRPEAPTIAHATFR